MSGKAAALSMGKARRHDSRAYRPIRSNDVDAVHGEERSANELVI